LRGAQAQGGAKLTDMISETRLLPLKKPISPPITRRMM